MNKNDDAIIASLAADLMLLTLDEDQWIAADDDLRYMIIRDYRDDFASSEDDRLADARMLPAMNELILDEMNRRLTA